MKITWNGVKKAGMIIGGLITAATGLGVAGSQIIGSKEENKQTEAQPVVETTQTTAEVVGGEENNNEQQ